MQGLQGKEGMKTEKKILKWSKTSKSVVEFEKGGLKGFSQSEAAEEGSGWERGIAAVAGSR